MSTRRKCQQCWSFQPQLASRSWCFMGVNHYYCGQLLPTRGDLSPPQLNLLSLLKKDVSWRWTSELQRCFEALQKSLTSAPVFYQNHNWDLSVTTAQTALHPFCSTDIPMALNNQSAARQRRWRQRSRTIPRSNEMVSVYLRCEEIPPAFIWYAVLRWQVSSPWSKAPDIQLDSTNSSTTSKVAVSRHKSSKFPRSIPWWHWLKSQLQKKQLPTQRCRKSWSSSKRNSSEMAWLQKKSCTQSSCPAARIGFSCLANVWSFRLNLNLSDMSSYHSYPIRPSSIDRYGCALMLANPTVLSCGCWMEREKDLLTDNQLSTKSASNADRRVTIDGFRYNNAKEPFRG